MWDSGIAICYESNTFRLITISIPIAVWNTKEQYILSILIMNCDGMAFSIISHSEEKEKEL